MLIADTLEDDFDIEEAEDGQQALQKMQDSFYDLVIMDYMMPYLSGIEVVEKARSLTINTPVLMLTAKAQQSDREEAVSKGAEYFMPKPFSPIALLHFVQSILE